MEANQMILLEEMMNVLWANEELKIVFLLDNKLCTGNFSVKNERNIASYYSYRHNIYEQGFSKVKLINKKFDNIINEFNQRLKEIYGVNVEVEKILSDFKEVAFVEMIRLIKEKTQSSSSFFNDGYFPKVIYNYKELNTGNELAFYYIGDKHVEPISLE